MKWVTCKEIFINTYMISLLCGIWNKQTHSSRDSWLLEMRERFLGELGTGGQKVQVSNCKKNSGDVTYTMVPVNPTAVYI